MEIKEHELAYWQEKPEGEGWRVAKPEIGEEFITFFKPIVIRKKGKGPRNDRCSGYRWTRKKEPSVYIVKTTLYEGESEGESIILVKADTKEHAQSCAVMCECLDVKGAIWSSPSCAEDGGRVYNADACRKVSKEEQEVFETELILIDYDPQELEASGNYKEL